MHYIRNCADGPPIDGSHLSTRLLSRGQNLAMHFVFVRHFLILEPGTDRFDFKSLQ